MGTWDAAVQANPAWAQQWGTKNSGIPREAGCPAADMDWWGSVCYGTCPAGYSRSFLCSCLEAKKEDTRASVRAQLGDQRQHVGTALPLGAARETITDCKKYGTATAMGTWDAAVQANPAWAQQWGTKNSGIPREAGCPAADMDWWGSVCYGACPAGYSRSFLCSCLEKKE